MELIALPEVLKEMERRDRTGKMVPFSIDFVTCNERTGEAGDVMKFASATLVFPNATGTRKYNPKKYLARQDLQVRMGKNPEHVRNGTINLQTDGKVITKAHIWLIRYFNKKQVVLHIHG